MVICGLTDEEIKERKKEIKKKIKENKAINDLLDKREEMLIALS